MEKATFAAGCFWGVESSFRHQHGVVDAQVGYTGGKTAWPSYKEVCRGGTGHAEAIEVVFDPQQVSYEELLALFWTLHKPVWPDRQGAAMDSQYRSAVFYHSPEQKASAERIKMELEKNGTYTLPIVTQIASVGVFWRAEEYHQRYNEKSGRGSCGL
jgi:peptide-methionine (S)-S-oxide reductase